MGTRLAWANREKRRGADPDLVALVHEGSETDDLPALPDVEFVHLREATLTSLPGRRLLLWRGRLCDIVGWSLRG